MSYLSSLVFSGHIFAFMKMYSPESRLCCILPEKQNLKIFFAYLLPGSLSKWKYRHLATRKRVVWLWNVNPIQAHAGLDSLTYCILYVQFVLCIQFIVYSINILTELQMWPKLCQVLGIK